MWGRLGRRCSGVVIGTGTGPLAVDAGGVPAVPALPNVYPERDGGGSIRSRSVDGVEK